MQWPDFPKGPPSNCTLIQSLMVQLPPALAGMACIFKMLNVFLQLSNMASIKTPLDVVSGIVKVAQAAAQLSGMLCLSAAADPLHDSRHFENDHFVPFVHHRRQ